jgi:5-epi-alpha-selinene synthase
MNQFVLPELYCPFPSQVNKYVDVLEDYSLEWVKRFNLLANESSYQRFRKSKFFLMAAKTYPYCQLEELKIGNDWLSWLFIWDDQCDLSDLKEQPELLKDFHQRFIEILNGAKLTKQDIPLAYALNDLRQRMLEKASLKWLDYFICGFGNYLRGCIEEAIDRVEGIVPNIETYTQLRRLSAGADIALPLVELCNHLTIPVFLRNHNVFRQINQMTNNLLGWSNDIFSVFREMATGHVHNLVLVLHYQQQLPLEKSIKLAASMHDQEVRSLMLLEASLPYFGEELDAELAKYISGMHAWIRGNIDWYSLTARYETLERLELGENLELVKY